MDHLHRGMANKALSRYRDILDGDALPRYRMSKRIGAGIRLDAPLEDLWRSHDALMGEDGPGHRAEDEPSLLDLKVEIGGRILRECALCERRCRVDRVAGEKGHCGVLEPMISSEFLHMGEEPDLVPSYTIFFSGCTFECAFCQNWDISTRPGTGRRISTTELARMIEKIGTVTGAGRPTSSARNVNWVGGDPTSNLPFILEVLDECDADLPQVWNSNMYLTTDSMKLLNGVTDVYLTDFKYGNDECALRLSNVPDYTRVVERNHLLGREHAEMIVRHLVLPGHLDCCTKPVLKWISENLRDVKVNVMAQYRPEHKAPQFKDISRPLRASEFLTALRTAEDLNLDLCE